MRFIMVSNYYPSEGDPIFVFSQQIAQAMANCHGIETLVISPQSITRKIRNRKRICKFEYEERIEGNEQSVKVYAYPYFSFSNTKNAFLKNIQRFSYKIALQKCIKKACIREDDYCYAMFWQMAKRFDEELNRMGLKANLLVESSESELECGEIYSKYKFNNLSGIICVSTEKKNECIEYKLLEKAPFVLIPNGYDDKLFIKYDKKLMRKKFGFDEKKTIVAFVGSFIERKGIVELNNVLKRFDDLYSIFIGSGPIEPDCNNILFKGSLDHDKIPEFLSCADYFIFPTKHEGCANAIIEALGCGLPVISSKRDFNNEILDDQCAILIDPDNEEELFEAVSLLRSNSELRERMSVHSLEKASGLTLRMRTEKILKFINSIGE